MAREPVEQTEDQPVNVEAAVKLAEALSNEEKVLGATLVLGQHSQLLLDPLKGRALRTRLRAAVAGEDANFLCRLLQSSVPLQRLAMGLITILAEPNAAPCLANTVPFLVRACAAAIESEPKADGFGAEEMSQAFELLKHLLELTEEDAGLSGAGDEVIALLLSSKGSKFLSQEEVAKSALIAAFAEPRKALSELLKGENQALPEAVILEPRLRGTAVQAAALRTLAHEWRRPPKRLDEVIASCVAAGAAVQCALLELAAVLLNVHGLSLGEKQRSLGRLKPLLVLASGELRLGLEGYGSKEGTVASCMALEAAIVAIGKEAEELESGNLEEVSNCLQELHKALKDIFDYCADMPASQELGIICRVVAAFQLEDPRHFVSEFERNMTTFCRLQPLEFKALLPCLQELQDWQSTPAFAKVLEVAKWSLENQPSEAEQMEVWRQCAMMVSEIGLDASVYLPALEIPDLKLAKAVTVPAAPCPEAVLACSVVEQLRLPRPVVASEVEDEGAQRLVGWSRTLWEAGSRHFLAQGGEPLLELTLLCASLLTSVPWQTLRDGWPLCGNEMWEAMAEYLLTDNEVEASTARLAVRLGGFCLDRHEALAQALVRVSRRLQRLSLSEKLERVLKTSPDDEWELADRAALSALTAFLTSSVKLDPKASSAYPAPGLDALD